MAANLSSGWPRMEWGCLVGKTATGLILMDPSAILGIVSGLYLFRFRFKWISNSKTWVVPAASLALWAVIISLTAILFQISSYKYLLFLPEEYMNQKNWPLILYLHGAGAQGKNPAILVRGDLPKIVDERPDFPFVVVAPQCSPGSWWAGNAEEPAEFGLVKAVLDDVISRYRVDRDRIYVTGVSMGGHGTWGLAVIYPDMFAAIAPVCGAGSVQEACRIQHIPVWVFHGARDDCVPISKAEEMVEALTKCGGEIKFTIYPEDGHGIGDKTYNNEELYEWFLSHKNKHRLNAVR